jgi:hypothetical protein
LLLQELAEVHAAGMHRAILRGFKQACGRGGLIDNKWKCRSAACRNTFYMMLEGNQERDLFAVRPQFAFTRSRKG